MRKFRPSGNVIIANQTFATDAPIVTWLESGWDAKSRYCITTETEPGAAGKCKVSPAGGHFPYEGPQILDRYSVRPALARFGKTPTGPAALEATKAVIKQFVVHHDGCSSADMCFNVLQNERGLSCHFLIDNDGTIFQTLDLSLAAWHAAAWNFGSIGVELCNRGDANKEPTFYANGKRGPQRDKRPIKINNHKIYSYDFTKEQYESFARLARALSRLLPNIPLEFPQSSPGKQHWGTLPTAASFGFAGYIGHYHLTEQKWDPGPFEFDKFLKRLRGAFCLPIFSREPKKDEDKPLVPEATEDLKKASDDLYRLNEQEADGGFFPVGPWGESRLWHGGIHLAAKANAPVFAPFPGRLVAARMGASSAIGSTNFVLLRHEMSLGQSKVQFYSLYMHLADELTAAAPVEWIAKADGGWKKDGKPGEVVLLDEPIEAGSTIGHVGQAGPADLRRAQIDVSFFANSELFSDVPGSPWEVIDGTAGGRFCEVPRVNDLIDKNKDGKADAKELKEFYASGEGAQARNWVTFHVSEWTAEPSWSDALRAPVDFKHLKPAEIDELVAQQITPGLWWDARVAKHCRLAQSGEVYHYNPVMFVSWFNQQLLSAQALAPDDQVLASETTEVPPGITDDFGDRDGSSMRSGATVADDTCNQNLGLQELVLGYDAPECESP